MEGVDIHALEQMHHIVVARLMPVTASVLIHVALVAGIFLLPAWTAPRESVLLLELVEPDAPPAPVVPPPVKPDPRPLTPPKPIKVPPPKPSKTPLPTPPPRVEMPTPIQPPVEPPAPRVETPPEPPKPIVSASSPPPVAAPSVAAAPQASTATASAPSGPSATAPSAPGTSASQSTFAISDQPSAPAAPSGPAVAAVPNDGITQRAMPRGGYQYRPSYPASARNLGIQGTTLLSILVDNDGRVADVVVKQSAGHPDLDQAAADAVRRWRFEPARRGSEPVAMWVLLPVEFKLR